jgi:hypothetical protein
MNTHPHHLTAVFDDAGRQMALEFVAEHLSLAQIYLAHALDCASVGDDFGLACALKKHGLLMRAVHETWREMAAKKEAARAR